LLIGKESFPQDTLNILRIAEVLFQSLPLRLEKICSIIPGTMKCATQQQLINDTGAGSVDKHSKNNNKYKRYG